MANDTKERILTAALEMFSQKGYDGTNNRELSASVRLVKSGIYKQFESKEAIWNALLDKKQFPRWKPSAGILLKHTKKDYRQEQNALPGQKR